jgi:hypothetical protein
VPQTGTQPLFRKAALATNNMAQVTQNVVGMFMLVVSIAAVGGSAGDIEDPPLSSHATKDKAQLPMEIASICGAYVAFVAILSLVFILLGRRSRNSFVKASSQKDLEMVRPMKVEYIRYDNPFDHKVIEDDKNKRQMDLEDIYAAVMDHDAQRSTSTVQTYGLDKKQPIVRVSPQTTPEADNHRFTNFSQPQHSQYAVSNDRIDEDGMTFDIQPPPTSMGVPQLSVQTNPTLPMPSNRSHHRMNSTESARTVASTTSNAKRRPAGSIRGQISSPYLHRKMGSDEQPLSANGAGYGRQIDSRDMLSDEDYLESPRSYTARRPAPSPFHPTPERETRPPQPLPIRTISANRSLQNVSTGGFNTPPSATTPVSAVSMAGSISRQLPLRQQALANGAGSGRSNQNSNTPSVPSMPERMQTTILDRQRRESMLKSPPLGTGNTMSTPFTPMYTPMTALTPGAHVPYTPLVPVTPRLIGRAERRQREKMASKRVIEELVPDDEDVWS